MNIQYYACDILDLQQFVLSNFGYYTQWFYQLKTFPIVLVSGVSFKQHSTTKETLIEHTMIITCISVQHRSVLSCVNKNNNTQWKHKKTTTLPPKNQCLSQLSGPHSQRFDEPSKYIRSNSSLSGLNF